ncbi:hypothetical protein ACF08M_31750 [Streptomyces sp. NPDC015032]
MTQSQKLCHDVDFNLGDMQFLNNYAILHSRTAYEDFAPPRTSAISFACG